jgi:lipopolysaccharide assembly outer membrane protein LptD (OstA)
MRCTTIRAVAALLCVAAVPLFAQMQDLPPGTEVTADSMEYIEDQKLMVGDGNVVIRQGEATLTADHVQINTLTQWAEAEGNVVYRRGETVWQGGKVRYNLKTKLIDAGESTAYVPPWNISAKSSERISTNEVLLKDVIITTCDPADPEYSIQAREARLIDGRHLRAKGVKFRYLGLPFFYLPNLNRDLGAHDYWWEFVPGYSSRHGAYLLSALNYRMGNQWMGRTRADYRSKRGFGVGQDVMWKGTNEMWDGELNVYYADDEEPFKDAEEEAALTNLVDNERYRIKLADFHSLTERDYIITDINYLSDPNIVKDFFNEEFRENTIPENRISLTHRGDRYTAGILFNKRLNDFYQNVDRLPEVTYDLQRIRIADSPFYYETENSAAQLEQVFAEDSGLDDYDALRVDSRHTVFYPTRQFGFLTLIPRAGYRGTYYSDTVENRTVTTTSIITDSNGVSSVATNLLSVVDKGGSDVRNLFELGFETSFKSHRTWNDVIVLGSDDGFRHIAEPFADYTYVPEPDLVPLDLPQFDAIDQLDERNDVRFGIRNKFQTKRRGRVHDLMDFNIFTTYRFDPKPEQEDFTDVGFDNELRIWDAFPIDFDGSYDTYGSEFSLFNTQISYLFDDQSSISLEYRYRRILDETLDDENQVATELVLFPNRRWSIQLYHRIDVENNRLDEHEYFLQKKSECLGYGIGFRQTDDDWQVWVRLFMLAFPESNIKLGQ